MAVLTLVRTASWFVFMFCPVCVKAHQVCVFPEVADREATWGLRWDNSRWRFPEDRDRQERAWNGIWPYTGLDTVNRYSSFHKGRGVEAFLLL